MAGLSVDILSPMPPLGIKELLTNVEQEAISSWIDPALMEFHSSAGRCIIKKGINTQFKYLWKCYEGHKIGYWMESN